MMTMNSAGRHHFYSVRPTGGSGFKTGTMSAMSIITSMRKIMHRQVKMGTTRANPMTCTSISDDRTMRVRGGAVLA